MKTQRNCFNLMPKVETFCVLLRMVSHNVVVFSWWLNSLVFPNFMRFHGSTPVDFYSLDFDNVHPRGDSSRSHVFDIIFKCGVNLKFNEIQHRFWSELHQRRDCVRSSIINDLFYFRNPCLSLLTPPHREVHYPPWKYRDFSEGGGGL